MKFYAAVLSKWEIGPVTVQPPFNILGSYHYFERHPEYLRECMEKGMDVFVDSGAFSAENKGAKIDIDEYCHFIKETKCGTYAGLDVIGDSKATKENQEYMERVYGLTPIPTFHMGSDPIALREMFGKYPYIALGGLVLSGGRERYCDEIWGMILRECPKLRVHGFGMTNFELMERYPWYSVDSSSYKSGRRYGRQQILWNGFDFITFQEKEYLEFLRGLHYDVDNLTKEQKRHIYDYYSVQSYKLYAEHLNAVNKIKDFSYLTAQLKMI